jgi:membrane-bound ClpP family serine protease
MERDTQSIGDSADMLARLMTQAAEAGQDLVAMRAMVEEASNLGATRALRRLGVSDDAASNDIAELRELLSAWRDAKAGAWKAALKWVLQWIFRGCLALLLLIIAAEISRLDMLR